MFWKNGILTVFYPSKNPQNLLQNILALRDIVGEEFLSALLFLQKAFLPNRRLLSEEN